jgi:hypothetical protein
MGRAIITIVVPLLLPTILYVGWRVAIRRGLNLPSTWMWLALSGLALASLALVAVSVDFGEPRNGVYVPPHLEGGEVVPGHVAPAPQR